MSDFNFGIQDVEPIVPEIKTEEVKIEIPKTESKPVNNKTSVLYALKNLTIPGVGSLLKGYNTVPANKVDKWLEKASVRLASAEEIKTYHNK